MIMQCVLSSACHSVGGVVGDCIQGVFVYLHHLCLCSAEGLSDISLLLCRTIGDVGATCWCSITLLYEVFFFWCLNLIAIEIENPFGTDPNDLDGWDMQEDSASSLCPSWRIPPLLYVVC